MSADSRQTCVRCEELRATAARVLTLIQVLNVEPDKRSAGRDQADLDEACRLLMEAIR